MGRCLHLLLLGMEGLLGDAEEVCHFLDENGVLILGEVVLEGHEVAGLFETEVELLGD